jgi:hypothetical protein
VFGLPILQVLYNEIRNGRRLRKIISIMATGCITLLFFASFLPLYNLYGYWEYCTQKPYAWFCSQTVFNMYDALQGRYWNLKFRFPLYVWGDGLSAQAVAIKTLIMVIVPFRWR